MYHTWPYNIIANLFDTNGYWVWDQFGTTVEHALEVLSNFDNDGHRVQFGSTTDPAIELLTYFDKGGHLNQFGTTV